MIAPPFLIGATLLLWGWQTDNLLVGTALALALEAPRRMALKFDLGAPEHSRIADLSTIGFVGITVLLALDRGVARGVLAAFAWLPVALAPMPINWIAVPVRSLNLFLLAVPPAPPTRTS